jgi:carboxypeptidase C (cathepsin A)
MNKWFLILCLGFFMAAHAEEKPASQPKEKEVLKEESSETTHVLRMNGQEIPYKATAGTLLFKEEGDSKASFFFVSYMKEGESDHSRRPITFCFNGGPGSSSIWLHMGVLGPKRVLIDQEQMTPPPYELVDNIYSLLDVTDLVFIDPVSTGYSRPAPGEDAKQFHGVEEDVKSVAEFIRLFTTRYNRWDSPKFLAGESYGTTRAAILAHYLHNELRYYINGLILASSVLNFQTLSFETGDDLSYILYLPSYTATAWYHKKLDADLQQDLKKTLAEVEQFALGDYTHALMLGDLLDPVKRAEISAKVARYTGLSQTFVEQANLRVCQTRFSKELLRSQNRTVGRFDSRFLGIDSDSCGEVSSYDPSADAVFGAFTAAFNTYVRTDLKWEKDEEYKVLANVWPWNYGNATNKYLNVTDELREVMTKNPALQVYVGSGYFDLATPYFGTDYTLHHLGLDPSLKGHVKVGYYPAGHMMYIHTPSLEQFKTEVAEFIQTALPKVPAMTVKNPYMQK